MRSQGFWFVLLYYKPLFKERVGYCTLYFGIVTNKGFTVQALS